MSDLISRSVTVKMLRDYAEQKFASGEIELANGILKAVNYIENDNIPIAYDLEGVIEELEGWKNRAKASINYYSENSSCYPCIHNKTNLQKKEYLVLKNVLRIVKSEITTNGKNGGC